MLRTTCFALFALLGSALPALAPEARACDCMPPSPQETFAEAEHVFVARTVAVDAPAPRADQTAAQVRVEVRYEVLHTLAGELPDEVTYAIRRGDDCYPWSQVGDLVLLVVGPGGVPDGCNHSAQLGWALYYDAVEYSGLGELLALAGARDGEVAREALVAALSGDAAASFLGAQHETPPVLLHPPLAGTQLDTGALALEVVATADDAPQGARVIEVETARSHDGLSYLALRHDAGGLVLRAATLAGDSGHELLVREIVEQ